MVFYQVFPLFSVTMYIKETAETVRGCVCLMKQKSQGNAVEVVHCKDEHS